MQGVKRAGRYRIIQANNTVLFFSVYKSDEDGALVICDVKWQTDAENPEAQPLNQYIDKSTKRVLTDAMWARLVSWC